MVNSIESNKQLERDTSNINLLFDYFQTLQNDDEKPKFDELGIIKKTKQQEAPKLELKQYTLSLHDALPIDRKSVV